MTKMIAMDVDGVLADYMRGVREAWGHITESDEPFPDHEHRQWDIAAHLPTERAKERYFEVVNSRGFCSSLVPFDGAREGVDMLRERARVVAVTAPMAGLHWAGERADWLRRVMGFKSHDIIQAHAKELVAADVIVDDKESTLHHWLEYQSVKRPYCSLTAVLWAQPYNLDFEGRDSDKHRGGQTLLVRTSSWDYVALVAGMRERSS